MIIHAAQTVLETVYLKILLVSFVFPPSIGGIETVSECLASQFTAMGHDVCVITSTPDSDGKFQPNNYKVFRNSDKRQMIALHKWCDLCFHDNISLQLAWPLLFVRRPWFIVHQIWIGDRSKQRPVDSLKRFALRFAHSISISQAIADNLNVKSDVVGNPYDDKIFREVGTVERNRDLVFVGRLVSAKGVDVLLRALHKVPGKTNLTIIGPGPCREELEKLTDELGLREQVQFVGPLKGEDLCLAINRHHVIVVPSIPDEPFGIVALEGIACGCAAIGSVGGGLKDAIGDCGLTFKNGDSDDLAAAISRIMSDKPLNDRIRELRSSHLATFSLGNVASRYIEIFQAVLKKA